MASHRICISCKNDQPLGFFSKDPKGRDGLYPYCRECRNGRHKRWRIKNQSRLSSVYRERHLRQKYGISVEAFDALFTSQGGKCAICKDELKAIHNFTWIDHNHVTGVVRGILCRSCNSGLGNFKDSPLHLENAVKYLKERTYFG